MVTQYNTYIIYICILIHTVWVYMQQNIKCCYNYNSWLSCSFLFVVKFWNFDISLKHCLIWWQRLILISYIIKKVDEDIFSIHNIQRIKYMWGIDKCLAHVYVSVEVTGTKASTHEICFSNSKLKNNNRKSFVFNFRWASEFVRLCRHVKGCHVGCHMMF